MPHFCRNVNEPLGGVVCFMFYKMTSKLVPKAHFKRLHLFRYIVASFASSPSKLLRKVVEGDLASQ